MNIVQSINALPLGRICGMVNQWSSMDFGQVVQIYPTSAVLLSTKLTLIVIILIPFLIQNSQHHKKKN